MNLEYRFKKFDRDYCDFDKIERKLASRPDLHAFILLNQLVPSSDPIVMSAEHDKAWLDINEEKLETILTDDHIRDLVRCGISWCLDNGGLCIHL